MLGNDVVDVLRHAGHEVTAATRRELDVREPSACLAAVAGHAALVNCAAWTDVDAAETAEAAAFAVNAVGAANLARAAAAVDAVLVQVSTDYVFDGLATEPWPVDAPVRPLNAYGRTKAAGEWAVRASCPRSYVLRTAWLYGEHGPNFVRTMLRLATERDVVEVVDDQWGQPTWTRDVADRIADLLDQQPPYDILHAASSGCTTWYGFAKAVFRLAGHDPDRVRPTTTERFPRPAPRPRCSVLHNASLGPWEDRLRQASMAMGWRRSSGV